MAIVRLSRATTPFMGPHERLPSDALTGRFGSSHSASSAYQKWAHWATLILSSSGLQSLQGGLLTHLKTATDLHQSFPLASSCPGIVHHLSGPNGVPLKLRHFHKWNARGSSGAPAREGTGIPDAADLRRPVLSFRRRAYSRPIDIAHMLTPWSVFQERVGISRAHPFTSKQFHVLLNSPSKFFATFPHGTCLLSVSRKYLALGGVYHPIKVGTSKQPDSKEIAPDRNLAAMGLPHPLWGNSPGQGDLLQSPFSGTLTPKPPHFSPRPLRAGDSALGFSPFTSPVTKGIPVGFFSSAYL
ncbi:hypothetical protein JTE90_006438 [Oedothorax gibbosus]|uniref:Uncharacterized protein n=1 Tax=Oedothorax gibbosus TaxID=931172 RepID=A0AAV6TDU8_9ARAC|nr:hypothetical protein JTE90_006438 [Oedothorax gibbosus]